MEIKNPRYFIAIAEEKSLSKAASRIFISQSSLSYYVTSLEKSIGTPLLHRIPNGVELTSAGEKYLSACRTVVELGDKLNDEIMESTSKGEISIAATSVWGRRALADLVPAFQQTHPNIRFKISHESSASIPAMIEDREVDFALISWSPYRPMQKDDHLLTMEPLLFAVSAFHPFVNDHPEEQLTIRQIAETFRDDLFILASSKSVSNIAVVHAFDDVDFHPAQTFEVDDHDLARELVARRCGVTFIPESVTETDDRIRYYTVPNLLRYNLLISKPQRLFAQYEQEFFEMILAYFHEGN